MPTIQASPLPEHALLQAYARRGAYTDCFTTDIPGAVSHAQYVEAFYTGTLFKLERQLLAWFVARPSSDAQARELARGGRDSFAAWQVEARTDNQLLMRDISARTCSWLMTEPASRDGKPCTRLYFGSAVVPRDGGKTGEARMGPGFNALLGFHKAYSRALLSAASSRVLRPDF